jgi:hypothetical protein
LYWAEKPPQGPTSFGSGDFHSRAAEILSYKKNLKFKSKFS